MRRSASIVLAVFAMSVFVISGVMAGTEPSPFQPQINQLYASENILRSIGHVLTQTMENPPIEGQPSPNLTGALNKLGTIDVRVVSVSGFITSIYEEVMGTEPSPFEPGIVEGIVDALNAVQAAADFIVEEIEGYHPPGGVPVDFFNALDAVQGSAQALSRQVESYIADLTQGECVRDDDYPGQEQCAEASCFWIVDPTSPELDYCCCPTTAP